MDAGLFAGDRQILTWAAECDDIHRFDLCTVDVHDIAKMLHAREPGSGHPDWVRLDLASPYRFDVE